jgi:Zn-finger domain-containing protein
VETPLTIRIELRDQYGKQVAHPVCDTAKTFAEIANSKTLTDQTLLRIAGLGYTIITTQREWRKP